MYVFAAKEQNAKGLNVTTQKYDEVSMIQLKQSDPVETGV